MGLNRRSISLQYQRGSAPHNTAVICILIHVKLGLHAYIKLVRLVYEFYTKLFADFTDGNKKLWKSLCLSLQKYDVIYEGKCILLTNVLKYIILHLLITFYLILLSVLLGYDTVSTDFGNEYQQFVLFPAPIIIEKLTQRPKSFIYTNITLDEHEVIWPVQ